MAASIFRDRFAVIKQFLFVMIFIVFATKGYAQEYSGPVGLEPDKQVKSEQTGVNFYQPLNMPLVFDAGELSFQKNAISDLLKLKVERPDFSIYPIRTFSFYPFGVSFTPFISAYSLNSFASYKLSDKLSLSGSNFSANSIFGVQPLHSSPDKMNIQGVNLHLEYKVSDKFRIGGGVQIYHDANGF